MADPVTIQVETKHYTPSNFEGATVGHKVETYTNTETIECNAGENYWPDNAAACVAKLNATEANRFQAVPSYWGLAATIVDTQAPVVEPSSSPKTPEDFYNPEW